MASSALTAGLILAEIPVCTAIAASAIGYLFRGRIAAGRKLRETIAQMPPAGELRDTLAAVRTRLEIDANDDNARDKTIQELKVRTATDHDLLIEWVGWAERHDAWSRERWDSHLSQYHHGGHAPGHG